MSPDLPPRARKVLEEAQASFSGKPLKVSLVYKLDPMHVRRALASARREASSDQVPVALYLPKGGEALIIMPADDAAGLFERSSSSASSSSTDASRGA
jgi:hypothetical protein